MSVCPEYQSFRVIEHNNHAEYLVAIRSWNMAGNGEEITPNLVSGQFYRDLGRNNGRFRAKVCV